MENFQEYQHPHQQAFVNRFVQACQTDDGFVAACLIGSMAKGTADRFSDVDLSVITAEDSYPDFTTGVHSFTIAG